MKKIIFSIVFFIMLMLVSNISNATTITVTPDAPSVGDEITITITVPNVHTSSVTANVSGVVSGTIKVVGGDLSGEVKDYSKSAKFTCSQEGNIKIEISSDSSAVLSGQYVNVSASKTVVVKAKPPVVTPPKEEEKPTTPTTPPATTVIKSSEARLKNFGIRPNDFKGFKKDTYEYTTEVPNEVKEVEIYAEKLHNKATVEGLGKVSLKEGDNKFEVKVTAENGTSTKTYKLTIKRKTASEEEEESGEVRLKSLGIKPKEYDFSGFDSEKTEYSVDVPNEVEEIEVYATARDSKAQITGTGMITLKEGQNELKIEVIAANGTKKTYTLTVTRKEAEKLETEKIEAVGLSTLSIEGLKLSPTFKSGIYEYTATLEKDVSSLEIDAKANSQDATVEIVGNENFQQGENVITILVTNKKTGEVATYQIIVNKNVTVVEAEQTSWLKPSTWGKEEKIKIAIILVLIILIIWAIILKIKISKQCPKNKKVDFPGAEELDKAIAEHQELVEEPNGEISDSEEQKMDYEQNIVNQEVEQQNYIEEIAKNRFGSIEKEIVEKPKRRGRHF